MFTLREWDSDPHKTESIQVEGVDGRRDEEGWKVGNGNDVQNEQPVAAAAAVQEEDLEVRLEVQPDPRRRRPGPVQRRRLPDVAVARSGCTPRGESS